MVKLVKGQIMVTMRDVAKKAGVSQATVSYALNNHPSIPEKTRRKVLKAAEAIHYRTNVSAKTLRSGKTDAIGLILQDFSSPYYSLLANAISRRAMQNGLQVLVQQTIYEKDNEIAILGHLVNSFCDGVIFTPTRLSSRDIKRQLAGRPGLILGPIDSGAGLDTISVDCISGIEDATRAVLAAGCTRPFFLGLPYRPISELASVVDSGWQRVFGFEQVLEEAGIAYGEKNFLACHWERKPASDFLDEYLDSLPSLQHLPFDALVCINDDSALGAYLSLKRHGISIPEQVCLTGFDGIPDGQLVDPQITTSALDFDYFADEAVRMISERINEKLTDAPHAPARHLSVHTHLLERGTTAR